MLLAYLRGLLRPKYDQGLRSILRENVLLEALSTQLDVDFVTTQTLAHASYAAALQPEGAKELITKQRSALQNLRYLAEFDDRVKSIVESMSSGEHADLITLYNALEEAGLVGEQIQ